MKKLLLFSFLVMFALGCKKDEVANPEMSVTTTLSGANEIPAVTTTAMGSVTGTFNKTTKILAITVNYSGMTPNAWHIHKGATGANGGVVFNLGTSFSSPFSYTTAALNTEQETDLLAGNFYVNLHSAKAPTGEIRGNLMVK